MRYPTAKSLNATANLYTFPHSIVLAAYLTVLKKTQEDKFRLPKTLFPNYFAMPYCNV
jgi:hypothetical protein